MEKEKYLPLNLQFFAGEEGQEQEQDTNSQNTKEDVQDTQKKEQEEGNQDKKTYTEDEIKDLKKTWEEENQKFEEEKIKKEVEKALKEQKRLSTLSEEERQKEEQDKKIKDLEEREQNLIFKEKLSDVKDELIKRKLPTTFAEFLVADTIEKTLEKITEFEKNFRNAVQEEVNSRITGVNLKTGYTTESKFGENMAKKLNSKKDQGLNPWA